MLELPNTRSLQTKYCTEETNNKQQKEQNKMKTTVSLMVLTFSLNVIGAEWFVATNGTGSGTGTIDNPWDLQCAGTNQLVTYGDTVWLRGGTYEPLASATNQPWSQYLHYLPGFLINPQQYGNLPGTNVITLCSYSNERARIDRPMMIGNSIRFLNLEFFDSNKGLFRTTSPSIATTNGIIWSHFIHGTNCFWDNCLIHDVNSAWGNPTVRDCLIWYVGWSVWEHVFYPGYNDGSPDLADLSGTIIAWPLNVTQNGAGRGICNSNLIFGENVLNLGINGVQDLYGTWNYQMIGNVFINPYEKNVVGTFNSGSVCKNNVFVGAGTVLQIQGSSLFASNTVFSASTSGGGGASGYVMSWNGLINQWVFDYNQYYTPLENIGRGNFLQFLGWTNGVYVGGPLSTWQAKTGFDQHSITNYGNPPDTVRVWQNRFQSKKASIIVCNWSQQNNVSVPLGSVLQTGDTYYLYNAQNYLAGPIQTNTYNGTNIVVPMTNLTTAPILYGTNGNAWGDTFTQPAPISPTYGAFVVIGIPLPIVQGFRLLPP